MPLEHFHSQGLAFSQFHVFVILANHIYELVKYYVIAQFTYMKILLTK